MARCERARRERAAQGTFDLRADGSASSRKMKRGTTTSDAAAVARCGRAGPLCRSNEGAEDGRTTARKTAYDGRPPRRACSLPARLRISCWWCVPMCELCVAVCCRKHHARTHSCAENSHHVSHTSHTPRTSHASRVTLHTSDTSQTYVCGGATHMSHTTDLIRDVCAPMCVMSLTTATECAMCVAPKVSVHV